MRFVFQGLLVVLVLLLPPPPPPHSLSVTDRKNVRDGQPDGRTLFCGVAWRPHPLRSVPPPEPGDRIESEKTTTE